MKKNDRMASRAGLDIYGLGKDRAKWDRALEAYTHLIVQECIDALWTKECHTSDLAVEDYNRNCRKIKERFGVEHEKGQ